MWKLKSGMRGVKEIIGTNRLEKKKGIDKTASLDVAIIGAGVSGLSSALFLKQLGCEVTVFEKDEAIKTEGAGIQITSNGLFVLEKLDLREKVVNSGLKPDKLCLYDEDQFRNIGRLEIFNRLKRRYGNPFVALGRSTLVKILFEKVKKKKIEIKFGSKALPLETEDQRNVFISYKGKKIKKDLIVIADGIDSSWKKTIFREIKARTISQSAYRFTLSISNLPLIFSQNNINLFFGKGRHFVTYPIGNGGMINFVFCKRERGHLVKSWKEKVTMQRFLNDFELNEELKACLPRVDAVYRWPVVESEIPVSIQKKNVVMVGDAAHAMLPYMAQGANKALEDSWVLASCLKEYPLDLKKALIKYSKKRIKRIHQLDQVSKFNEKLYHVEKKVLRRIFIIFLRVITRLMPNLFFKRLDWVYNYKG